MKNIILIIIVFGVTQGNAQWLNKTSCNKKAEVIANKAIDHMSNLEFLIALGMAKAALVVDDNCGCAKLTIAAISSNNENWGSQKEKLMSIGRNNLSLEEQAWYDYLMTPRNKRSELQKRAVKKYPDSPIINYLGTTTQDFNTYSDFAAKFPNLSAFAHNMLSYGYMAGGTFGESNPEMAMTHIQKSTEMHDGPNVYDSKAEHLSSLGNYEEAAQAQLKAIDYAVFASPYRLKARLYFDKMNSEDISKALMDAQVEMQDAILERDYSKYKKFEHDDIKVTTGDSNLNPFYVYTKDDLESSANMTWDSFEFDNMNVYFAPDMKSAAITFNADGSYTMNDTNETIDYATRGSSFWTATDDGWKIIHSSWSPRKGRIGIPSNE